MCAKSDPSPTGWTQLPNRERAEKQGLLTTENHPHDQHRFFLPTLGECKGTIWPENQFSPKKYASFQLFFANPIPDPLMVGRGDGGLGGHEGDRMNKEEEVVDKSTLPMLRKFF